MSSSTRTRSQRSRLTATRSAFGTGSLTFIVSMTVINGSNLVLHLVLSRLLGPGDYGALVALTSIVTFLSVPLSALETAVAQAAAQWKGKPEQLPLRKPIKGAALVGSALTGLMCLASPGIAAVMHVSIPSVIVTAAWIPLAAMVAVLQGALIGRKRFSRVALSQALGPSIGKLLVALVLVKLGAGVAGGLAATTLGSAISLVVLLPVLIPTGSEHGHSILDMAQAWHTVAALAGVTVMTSIDGWLARVLIPSKASGYFGAASTTGKIPMFLPAAIALVAFPAFAEAEGRGREARRLLMLASAATGALSGAAALALLLDPGPIVGVLYGSKFLPARSLMGLVGCADACIALTTILVYFQRARRSWVAMAGWPSAALATALAFLFHGSALTLAYDLLTAAAVTCGAVAVTTMAQLRLDPPSSTHSVQPSPPAMAGPPFPT